MEDDDSDDLGATETNACNGDIPEWALVLEPVRKLPTNVGTRIRKCVYEALERNPPEWAKKILEHSISKEVYKGNASGPTKVRSLKPIVFPPKILDFEPRKLSISCFLKFPFLVFVLAVM